MGRGLGLLNWGACVDGELLENAWTRPGEEGGRTGCVERVDAV